MIIKLSFNLPLANAITVFPFIFVSRIVQEWTEPAMSRLIMHEKTHLAQQRRWLVRGVGVGLPIWWILYLFCLPICCNPWRRKWETEAFVAEGLSPGSIDSLLSRSPYWLIAARKHQRRSDNG